MRKRLFWGAVTAALVVWAAWSLIPRGDGEAPSPPPASSTATPDSGTSVTLPDKDTLNKRVKIFSRLFYSLDPAISNEEVMESVRPYATDDFMATARFGYGDSAADEAMLREGAVLKVRAVSGLIGQAPTDNVVDGSVALQVTKLDRNGVIVLQYERQQQMTWKWSDGAWRIDNAPRD